MNRGEIRNLARVKIGEVVARLFQNVDLNAWINNAGDDIAYKTKCLRTTGSLTTTSASEYTISTALADDVLSINELYIYQNTRWVKLEPTTRTELDILSDGWMSQPAAPPDKYWYDIQLDLIGLYPKPNTDNQGTDYVKAYYVQKFTPLTADTGTPVLPTQLHLAMSDYVAATALDSKTNDKASVIKANNSWLQYQRRILEYLAESKREKEDETIIMKGYRNI